MENFDLNAILGEIEQNLLQNAYTLLSEVKPC